MQEAQCASSPLCFSLGYSHGLTGITGRGISFLSKCGRDAEARVRRRERRETEHTSSERGGKVNANDMKEIILLLILGIAGGGYLWYRADCAKQERRERIQRQQDAERRQREVEQRQREAEQRAEDERIRKERMAAVAKEDAVKLFVRYIEKEEDRLKDLIEESKLKLAEIAVDQQSLSDELVILGQRNAGESAASKKRGEKRRDEVEYVKRLLASPVLNRLAGTYLGEDFSALRTEFRNKIQTVVGLRDELVSRRAANQRVYEEAVGGVDGDVNTKTRLAEEKSKETRDRILGHLKELEGRVDALRSRIKKLENKASKSPWDDKELTSLRKELEVAELSVSHYRDVEGLSSVNTLQNEALLAETRARRAHDTALDNRTRADDEALEEHTHELGVFAIATDYEARSLDAVRAAMRNQQKMLAFRISDATSKMSFLTETATNIDFLNAEEVEELRRKIARRLSVNVVEKGLDE